MWLKDLLFNYNTTDIGGHWIYSVPYIYTPNDGYYAISDGSYIKDSTYKGEWIIIKLPSKIILTKFQFYQRPGYTSRTPGLWRWYGSNDGVNYNEITEASNNVSLLLSSYSSGYYEKILNSTFTTPYLYIGLVVNKLTGGDSEALMLNFAELKIFGKELNNFQSDWNSTIINKPDLSVYATNTNLNTLSSYSYLNISGTNNNLNTLSSYSYLNIV